MKQLKILLVLVILVAAGIGISRLLHDDPKAMAAAAPAAMPPMPVAAMVLDEKPVAIWKDFPGRLEAVDSVQLRPQVSGTIKEIKFEDGQMVKAGDVLFVIDPRPYEADIAQSSADLQAAKNQYELAQKELKRAQELITTGTIPKSTLDTRQSAELVGRSAVASAEARLNRAKLNLDYAYVKAPISGRVNRAEITVGNLVDAGANAPVLTSIVSSEGIYAGFEVDEQTYLRFVRGNGKDPVNEQKIPVQISLQSAPDAVYEGNIHSFDNKIDTASGTIRARALFKNEDGTLLPGMFVSVRLGSAESKSVVLVPERAVGTDQSRKFVYVVSPEKKVTYREVSLGDHVGDSRVVLSGLSAGDTVITDGLMKLRPDMLVEPQIQQAAADPAADPGAPSAANAPAAEVPAAGTEDMSQDKTGVKSDEQAPPKELLKQEKQ